MCQPVSPRWCQNCENIWHPERYVNARKKPSRIVCPRSRSSLDAINCSKYSTFFKLKTDRKVLFTFMLSLCKISTSKKLAQTGSKIRTRKVVWIFAKFSCLVWPLSLLTWTPVEIWAFFIGLYSAIPLQTSSALYWVKFVLNVASKYEFISLFAYIIVHTFPWNE